MLLTAEIYEQAADRLEALADSPNARVVTGPHNQHFDISLLAFDWALQLRGAATAIAHHEDTIDANSIIGVGDYRRNHSPCIALADDLAEARDAIWEFLDRRDSPAPEIRDRALEILEGCAARWIV